ncbi:DoxX family protein [Paenibacillus roseipurpureus]|uniref:DoxX family protein n=1 Tax=Paenibacillus roseopurpureus TaxID=2918901 RepID=A0AA96LS02_9BACL|nr:DoxX family protein [Paenibacillus sp. MBLB1832]WNR44979.1 DoxX family protein [Paenibacillus sp. MBLB1832]
MANRNERNKLIAYWVTTILGPASFVIGGFFFITHGEQQIATLDALGYPEYVLTILGFWKLMAVIAILIPRFPRLKEWAYAGFFFELTGAAASHLLNGDSFAVAAQALVFLALVMASWALRPRSRKLVN